MLVKVRVAIGVFPHHLQEKTVGIDYAYALLRENINTRLLFALCYHEKFWF